ERDGDVPDANRLSGCTGRCRGGHDLPKRVSRGILTRSGAHRQDRQTRGEISVPGEHERSVGRTIAVGRDGPREPVGAGLGVRSRWAGAHEDASSGEQTGGDGANRTVDLRSSVPRLASTGRHVGGIVRVAEKTTIGEYY